MGQFEKLTAVDKRFQDVLLNIEIAVDDGGLLLPEFGQIVDGFADTIVVDVVGGRFGAEIGTIADVLFGETVAVVASDNGTGQIHILDDGLKLASIELADFAA